MKKVRIIHGPNLNLLGHREPDVYGALTLTQINQHITQWAESKGIHCDISQFNAESDILSAIQALIGQPYLGLVINPAAYTHTSVAIRDAIEAIQMPVIEVHLSHVHAREEFRQKSLVAPVCTGQITGLGWVGYALAVEYLSHRVR